MRRILVAGIGNIFFGDDAFGCEVVQELTKRPLSDRVSIVDFGIRGYDLAYAIMDGYDAVILIDATHRGDAPGSVYLMELDAAKVADSDGGITDAHSLTPARVLQLVRSLGGAPNNLYLVGCEPAKLDCEDSGFGLSDPVRTAVSVAVEIIEDFTNELLSRPLPAASTI